jgi:hypothetical protein
VGVSVTLRIPGHMGVVLSISDLCRGNASGVTKE